MFPSTTRRVTQKTAEQLNEQVRQYPRTSASKTKYSIIESIPLEGAKICKQ